MADEAVHYKRNMDIYYCNIRQLPSKRFVCGQKKQQTVQAGVASLKIHGWSFVSDKPRIFE